MIVVAEKDILVGQDRFSDPEGLQEVFVGGEVTQNLPRFRDNFTFQKGIRATRIMMGDAEALSPSDQALFDHTMRRTMTIAGRLRHVTFMVVLTIHDQKIGIGKVLAEIHPSPHFVLVISAENEDFARRHLMETIRNTGWVPMIRTLHGDHQALVDREALAVDRQLLLTIESLDVIIPIENTKASLRMNNHHRNLEVRQGFEIHLMSDAPCIHREKRTLEEVLDHLFGTDPIVHRPVKRHRNAVDKGRWSQSKAHQVIVMPVREQDHILEISTSKFRKVLPASRNESSTGIEHQVHAERQALGHDLKAGRITACNFAFRAANCDRTPSTPSFDLHGDSPIA